MAEDTRTGLLVLHGNRLELLAEAVFDWLARHPLAPLEPEAVLVQSNGMAEWFKMELAGAHGICAATRVELPARFIWRAYRAVLGRNAVPGTAPLDKLPLTWRLMQLLPRLAREPGFEAVRGFLGADGDPARRLQLAQRLADLFDQYQVHRSDWLQDWLHGGESGHDIVPADQRWQPALWRALQATLTADEREASRAALHQRFVQALRRPTVPGVRAFPGLPRRIVLFGITHLPHQTLEAVAALAGHCQVLMAVLNPCRFHWADTIEGRELLRFERRRHALRGGCDLAAVPLQDMHAHGHPLLSAWGRQCRDFVRQLDAYDDAPAAQQRFGLARVDLFDEAPAASLLQQVQAAVRELLPLAEHPARQAAADDRSIVFHIAHSAQREVEILHDQLLHLLAHPPEAAKRGALAPRDIVVMVPDIDTFAPAIRAVFGQHPRRDPRHIPWGIADQTERGHQPLLVALEWLLRLPQLRAGASEVRDLLDVAAVAGRFGITPEDLPTLAQWIEGAGVRWGLNAAHRASLGLGAGGEPNTWAFGLRRMLLGYAVGESGVQAGAGAEGVADIEPYAEVAGLGAGLAGALADLLQALSGWWADALTPRPPVAWAERLRRLLAELFATTDDGDRALLAALDDALAEWLQACETAGFSEPVELAVVREVWLEAVEAPGVARRFKAGGVTFCTLLPLRAIPFEVVCLLGMNDGDYPRRGSRNDFDLMALPGQARPGDRSRRDDDRQLMLDALLSARRVLYLSWAGRSQRDNQAQPPSVLVAQLRDYLVGGWGKEVLAQRTTEHPLQPFSRRYFESVAASGSAPGDEPAAPVYPDGLFTYAAEWRAAHLEGEDSADASRPAAQGAALAAEISVAPMTVLALATFLRNPVKAFFRHRLQVSFDDLDAAADDDEAFATRGRERWALLDEVLRASRGAAAAPGSAPGALAGPSPEPLEAALASQVAGLQRAGRLPLAGPGRAAQAELLQALRPAIEAWQAALAEHPHERAPQPLRWVHPHDARLVFDDTLTGLRSASAESPPLWIELQASKLSDPGTRTGGPQPRVDKLLAAWVRCLVSAACGCPADGVLIGEGALLRVSPPPQAEAVATLAALMQACREGLSGARPLPTAVATGTAWLSRPAAAREAFEGRFRSPVPGEGREPCLARLFPDFASLAADPGFAAASACLYEPYRQWLAGHVDVTLLGAQSGAHGGLSGHGGHATPATQEAGHE